MHEPASQDEKRTVSLPTEQANYIDGLVAAGTFASESEVIRAGLRALQEGDATRDAEVERWLLEEVVPVYDEMKAEPGLARPLAEVRERLRARHQKRLADEAR